MKTITLYQIDELSAESKASALKELAENYEYPFDNENQETLDGFNELTGNDYESEIYELTGYRLAAWIHNNWYDDIFKPKIYYKNGKRRCSKITRVADCPLTGYYMDMETLNPIIDFLQKPDGRNLRQLLNDCFKSFHKACEDDYDYCLSDESLTDYAMANEYYFNESGRIVE